MISQVKILKFEFRIQDLEIYAKTWLDITLLQNLSSSLICQNMCNLYPGSKAAGKLPLSFSLHVQKQEQRDETTERRGEYPVVS